METKIHPQIKEWFSQRGEVFGGTAEIELAIKLKIKPSNVSRALREASSGKDRGGRPCEKYLEGWLVPNPKGKGADVVKYKLSETISPLEVKTYPTQPKFDPRFAVTSFKQASML